MTDTWYFAYGSNLLIDQKQWRTGTIRRATRCRLPGYRFALNKRAQSGDGVYANIVPDESQIVWGVAYLCDDEAISELDGYEGVSGGHYRHYQVEVVTDAGDVLQAMTYVAGDDHVGDEGRPRADYLDTVLAGAYQHGLPEEYIATLEALGTRESAANRGVGVSEPNEART